MLLKSLHCLMKVIALFQHFFLQFRHIVKINQKAHNTTTSRPPVPCILQILTTFNLYSGRPGVGLSVNNKQKARQAMVKISRGGMTTNPPPPPLGQICYPKWLDHRRVNERKVNQSSLRADSRAFCRNNS